MKKIIIMLYIYYEWLHFKPLEAYTFFEWYKKQAEMYKNCTISELLRMYRVFTRALKLQKKNAVVDGKK